jgi:hypothetical protein
MLFVLVGTSLALALLHPWGSLRHAALRFTPAAAGVAIALAQLRWQKRFMTPSIAYLPTLWHPPLYKLERIPDLLIPATDPVVHAAMVALCLLAIGTFVWLRSRERRSSGQARPRLRADPRAWAHQYRWELFSATCFVAFMAFPLTLNGATLVYQRWFPPAFAVLAVAVAPRDLWTRSAFVTRIAVAVLPLATLLVVWPAFADSSREYEALETLMPYIDRGSAVAEVDLGPGDATRTYSLGTASGRILAQRGGRLVYAFTDSPISPAVIPRRYQWQEALFRVAFDAYDFRPAHDLRRFRYVLLRTINPQRLWMATYALSEDAEYIAGGGEWLLFRSRYPVAPLTSPDWPMEQPPPPSLRDKLADVARKLEQAAQATPPM